MGPETEGIYSKPQGTLITPSASPPSRSFFPEPFRIPDQPSLTKRPRLSPASRQNSRDNVAPSSSSSVDPFDFQQAREDSTMRLLNIWSNLERYVKPLDEDDIVDISTGKLIKDRGVLRKSHRWDVGCFANTMGIGGEDEEREEEDAEDDDIDELDAFAEEDEVQELGVDLDSINVPPVRSVDPEDAKELEEFMEAERRRKEEYGSDLDDGISEAEEDTTPAPARIPLTTQRRNQQQSQSQRTTTHTSGNNATRGFTASRTSTTKNQPIVDEDSTDELDNWEHDEASMVYRVSKEESSDSEIEFVDGPVLRPSDSASKPNQARTRPPVQQLQTPPRSHASTIIPSSPFEEFIELPPESSSPVRSSSPLPDYDYDSSPVRPGTANRSKSSKKPSMKPPSVIPRIDLRKQNITTRQSPSVEPSSSRRASPSPKSLPASKPSRSTRVASVIPPREKSAPVGRGRSQVEVLITTKPPIPLSRKSVPPAPVRRSVTSTDKGKQKASEESEAEDSQDDHERVTTAVRGRSRSPTKPTSKGKHRAKEAASPSPESERAKVGPLASNAKITKPPEKSSRYGDIAAQTTKGTKRKRVISAVEETTSPGPSRSASPTKAAAEQSKVHGQGEEEEADALKTPSRDKSAKASSSKSKSKSRARSRSRRRSPSPEVSSEDDLPKQRSRSRASSQHPHPQYYPYPQMPYTPQPHNPQQNAYPMPDPRAQMIISQAMQQLSALVGAWPPPQDGAGRASTPFVPPYQYHGNPNGFFSTPTHHPHPYPYAYDPNFSRATAPPDTPDTHSRSGSSRRKSLVDRSHSRGRNVSFQGYRNSSEDEDEERSHSSAPQTPEPPKTRSKGKSRARSVSEDPLDTAKAGTRSRSQRSKSVVISESEAEEEEEPVSRSRGRRSGRGQTPGPPSRATSSDSAGVGTTKSQAASRRAQKRH